MTHILITDLREIRYMAYVPEEPKYKVNCGGTHACTCASLAFENGANRDVVDEYDDNCPHRYKSDLEKAKRESLEIDREEDIQRVKQVLYESTKQHHKMLFFKDWHDTVLKPGIYQVPVEVEVVTVDDSGLPNTTKKVARIVQPKEKEKTMIEDFNKFIDNLPDAKLDEMIREIEEQSEPKPESQEESDWQNSDISDPLWKVVSNAFKTYTPEAAVKWLKYQGYEIRKRG